MTWELRICKKTLTTREAAHEMNNFLPLLHNSFDIVPHPNAYNRREDRFAANLLPLAGEFKSWRAVNPTANGNCLFNSASILLTGNASLSGILHLLTVAELLAYSDFYGTHPQISEFSEASGYSPPTVFNIF